MLLQFGAGGAVVVLHHVTLVGHLVLLRMLLNLWV